MAKQDETNQVAQQIVSEKQMETDAQKAKELLVEFSQWNAKAMDFIRQTGNPPQDPLTFCRNVVLTYGMKKLESKIITLG